LYRAGLALQAITPNWTRWKVTLLAGMITTLLSCFPVFFMKLLDYVAIYGLVLMPVGAIVMAGQWIFPALNIPQYQAEKNKWLFSGKAVIVWGGTLIVCYFLLIHLYFRWLPGYIFALLFYVVLQKTGGKRTC
jgi:hypothetical protein